MRRSSNSPRYFAPAISARQVQGDEPLVLEALRDIPGDDAPGQSFHNRRLAHARLANQDRVVLRAPGKHLDAAPDFHVPANDRVELVLLGQASQVAAILLQRLISGLRIGAGYALVPANLGEGLQKLVAACVEVLKDLPDGRIGRLIEHRQGKMFYADVFVFKALGLVLGFCQQFVQALRHVEPLAGRRVAAHARDAA